MITQKGGAAVKSLKRQAVLAVFSVLIVLVLASAVTFAWFTSNQQVSTSRAEARTGEENVELLLSSTGGADFRGSSEADISQVNNADSECLMPVSTSDLNTFFTATSFRSGAADRFSVLDNDNDYYHGKIYLRASAGGNYSSGSRMALYLDQSIESGGVLAQKDEDSYLLNAARLGLSIDGRNYIFYLSDETNAEGDRERNTNLNGTLLAEGMVLSGSNASVSAVPDPAVSLSSYAVGDEGTNVGEPLCYLELDRIYEMDVYFYLEGCDPDCCDSIFFHGSDLHLAFYGVLG